MAKSTSAGKRPKAHRSSDRVILAATMPSVLPPLEAGLPMKAVYGALSCTARGLSESWVVGVSGWAWRLVFAGPSLLLPETPFVGNRALATQGLRLNGLAPTWRMQTKGEETVALIVEALRAGQPVILAGHHGPDRWGVLCGHNRRRRVFLYWDPVLGAREPVELAVDAFGEGVGTALVLLRMVETPTTRKQAFLDSLKSAVAWAGVGLQQIDADCPTIHYGGYTAYQHWISLLSGPVPRLATREEARIHARIVAETAYARAAAADFLRKGSRFVHSEATEILAMAATAFEEVAGHFQRIMSLFPLSQPSFEHASEGAEALKCAFAAERLGIGHIHRLLRATQALEA